MSYFPGNTGNKQISHKKIPATNFRRDHTNRDRTSRVHTSRDRTIRIIIKSLIHEYLALTLKQTALGNNLTVPVGGNPAGQRIFHGINR